MNTTATSPFSLLKLICYVKGMLFKQAFKVKIGNEGFVAAPMVKAKKAQKIGRASCRERVSPYV